jgi:hypothetical protein
MRFWVSVSILALGCGFLAEQNRAKAVRQPEATHRYNELTLAGLRPGRDSIAKAVQRFRLKPITASESSMSWHDECTNFDLFVDVEKTRKIQSVRVAVNDKGSPAQCELSNKYKQWWITGKNLMLEDASYRVTDIYGKPDSRSPSTKGGQRLELLYYAFDWAGPDVPQVMEVLCTPEKDGKPGRVVEITLAGPSL